MINSMETRYIRAFPAVLRLTRSHAFVVLIMSDQCQCIAGQRDFLLLPQTCHEGLAGLTAVSVRASTMKLPPTERHYS